MMIDKTYMVKNMRNGDGSANTRNVVLAAACEAVDLFQCMVLMDRDFGDWTQFIFRLEQYLQCGDFEKIHDICQTLYAIKHLTEELEGLYLVREDGELCALYYQVFVGMLDLTLFSAKTMLEMNGGEKDA